MIKIYTISSCTSCKKAKTWLNKHQLPYKEQNLGKEPLTKEEILNILSKTENGVESIVSSKNRYAKALNCDIDELSVSEVIDFPDPDSPTIPTISPLFTSIFTCLTTSMPSKETDKSSI